MIVVDSIISIFHLDFLRRKDLSRFIKYTCNFENNASLRSTKVFFIISKWRIKERHHNFMYSYYLIPFKYSIDIVIYVVSLSLRKLHSRNCLNSFSSSSNRITKSFKLSTRESSFDSYYIFE